MKKKLIRDLSASTLQVVMNQLLGLVIFYFTSRFLSKDLYGELNWTIAIIATMVIVIGLGMEQIVLRRVAANKDGVTAAKVFLFHTIFSSLLFIGLLLVARLLFPGFFNTHFLIIGIGVSTALSYIASPFRQIVNGREKFSYLAVIMLTSNFIKAILLISCIIFLQLSAVQIIGIFIISSFAELVAAVIIMKKMNQPLKPVWNKREFRSLVHDSLPQLGVIIFDSALARIDWILLGFITGAVATADYSFAYKIFEISRMPMLVIAPIILPKFSRYFSATQMTGETKERLELLFRFEIVIAFLIPLFFNLVWTPFFSAITAGKYGSDENIYLILSFSVPLHYITNFLWTMAFAQNQLKQTFFITIVISSLNIILNLILIPRMQATGAAIVFTASTVVQAILYKLLTKQDKIKLSLYPFVICLVIASALVFALKYYSVNVVAAAAIGIGVYIILIFALRIIHSNDIKKIGSLLSR